MRDLSALYYECHVTLDPPPQEKILLLESISGLHGFRVSTFVMLTKDEKPKAFTSARDGSYSRMCVRMDALVRELIQEGFRVTRYKIEDRDRTIFWDTRA